MFDKKKQEKDYSQSEWIDEVLENAIESRASDVHLEPERENVDIKLRIDGIMHDVESMPLSAIEQTVSRIKVLAGMDTTVRHLPQDGHFEFQFNDRIYNFRVSTVPTTYGEAVVLRILNREDILMDLKDLGLSGNQLQDVKDLIASPFGMILATGPSNSGKTTLLYSMLHRLNSSKNNLITIENPVEFEMEGVRQIQVNESIDLSFARSVRAVLRQNPDIIMLGEIRDPDTAQMTMQAALTGHLVFSTFHTLDVPALVIRFMEMGVPRSVVAHTIAGVISSRLLRRICDDCRAGLDISAEKREKIAEASGVSNLNLCYGEGCEECRGSGYRGRIGIFEVVPFGDELRSLILDGASVPEVEKFLEQKKVKSLEEAGLEKVARGFTTLEEVERIIGISI